MNARGKALSLSVLFAVTGGAAFGLPDDRTVYLGIHRNPENSQSAIQYTVAVSVSAIEQDGDWIGWEVLQVEVREKATLGSDTVWAVDLPYVGTPDGLWWVEHADPSAPVRSEFIVPAALADTAVAQDASVPDLEFYIEGVPYAPPPDGAPYDVTGALDFSFSLTESTQADPDSEPDDQGDDEPIELPDSPDPPPPTSQ